MGGDVCDEVASILIPWPDKQETGEVYDQMVYNQLCDEAHRARLEEAESMRLAWQDGGVDPVIAGVHHARTKMLEAEQEMRRLLAYAREFTRPRPYTLADLAMAAGMSISGIRTAYDEDEIAYVAQATGRPDPRPAD